MCSERIGFSSCSWGCASSAVIKRLQALESPTARGQWLRAGIFKISRCGVGRIRILVTTGIQLYCFLSTLEGRWEVCFYAAFTDWETAEFSSVVIEMWACV